MYTDYVAHNILVFDGGRTVKLTDFGTAVAVGKAQTLRGCTPHFAAPEIIKQEFPKFPADIWSVLCTLVEMLTARWPGCYLVERPEMVMMFLVSVWCKAHNIMYIITSMFDVTIMG